MYNLIEYSDNYSKTSGRLWQYCRDIPAGDDYTTSCLLGYTYFKKYYQIIAIDLSKQQTLDANPRAIQQINFTANLYKEGNTTMSFIIEEAKETVLDFSKGTAKVL